MELDLMGSHEKRREDGRTNRFAEGREGGNDKVIASQTPSDDKGRGMVDAARLVEAPPTDLNRPAYL